jgi:nucleoid DNA-binding protein
MTKSELITQLSEKFSQLVHKDAELSVESRSGVLEALV